MRRQPINHRYHILITQQIGNPELQFTRLASA
jgi:hypothetical protein